MKRYLSIGLALGLPAAALSAHYIIGEHIIVKEAYETIRYLDSIFGHPDLEEFRVLLSKHPNKEYDEPFTLMNYSLNKLKYTVGISPDNTCVVRVDDIDIYLRPQEGNTGAFKPEIIYNGYELDQETLSEHGFNMALASSFANKSLAAAMEILKKQSKNEAKIAAMGLEPIIKGALNDIYQEEFSFADDYEDEP